MSFFLRICNEELSEFLGVRQNFFDIIYLYLNNQDHIMEKKSPSPAEIFRR